MSREWETTPGGWRVSVTILARIARVKVAARFGGQVAAAPADGLQESDEVTRGLP